VDPNWQSFLALDVSEHERDVLLEARTVAGIGRPENVSRKVAEARRQLGRS
jgi:hypothetical protein